MSIFILNICFYKFRSLEKQLHHNQLYDLYSDDYKQNRELKINDRKPFLLPTTYQNPLSPKRYVSSITWHPTIAGISL